MRASTSNPTKATPRNAHSPPPCERLPLRVADRANEGEHPRRDQYEADEDEPNERNEENGHDDDLRHFVRRRDRSATART